jgi:hypothetical protein
MRLRRTSQLLVLAMLTLPLSQMVFQGCATIGDGPTQKVNVRTAPAGAQVFLNGRSVGQTPITARISRWGVHHVRIEMAGYQPVDIPLEKRFNHLAEFNLFIGEIWIVVDAITGAIYWQDVPAARRAELQQDKGAAQDFTFGNPAVTISTTLTPLPGARKIGQMQRQ